MRAQVRERAQEAALRICTPVDTRTHPPEHHGARAHRARLQGDVHGASIQAPVAQQRRRRPHREQLGVRRGVLVEQAAVVRSRITSVIQVTGNFPVD